LAFGLSWARVELEMRVRLLKMQHEVLRGRMRVVVS
jgi:hypothetical protein